MKTKFILPLLLIGCVSESSDDLGDETTSSSTSSDPSSTTTSESSSTSFDGSTSSGTTFSSSEGSVAETGESSSETGSSAETSGEGSSSSSSSSGGELSSSEEGSSSGEPCAVGSLSCECTAGGACDPGLVCAQGICGPIPSVCGNGFVEPGEQCDDGDLNNYDSCLSDCRHAFCGDGFIQPGEGEQCEGESNCSELTCQWLFCDTFQMNHDENRASGQPGGWGLGTSDFTFEFWVQVHDQWEITEANGKIWASNEQESVNNVAALYYQTLGAVRITAYDGIGIPMGGIGNVSLYAHGVADNEWHHIAAVRDGDFVDLYVDGDYRGSDDTDIVLAESSNVVVGRQAGIENSQAAPVNLGPMRFSSTARYDGNFFPRGDWEIDNNTVSQYLVDNPVLNDGVDYYMLDEAFNPVRNTLYGGIPGGYICD